jgi:hypothetical protein
LQAKVCCAQILRWPCHYPMILSCITAMPETLLLLLVAGQVPEGGSRGGVVSNWPHQPCALNAELPRPHRLHPTTAAAPELAITAISNTSGKGSNAAAAAGARQSGA